MTWGVMSHREPAWRTAAGYNYRDDHSRLATQRALSWMLQAAIHGDPEALEIAGPMLNSTDPSVVARREELLAERGQWPNGRPDGK
jgi:hypothetical protein